MLVKKIFLSKYFITSRLEVFTNSIQEHLHQNYWTQKFNQKETIQEIVEKSQPLTETVETKKTYINTPPREKQVNIKDKQILQTKHPSKVVLYIKNFFAENLLAKIGSILVFIGVVFLMSLIWNQIPNVGKIIIGFSIWFTTYTAWVILDKKGLSGEARTLLWTWILINFLVILAWKHLIWDNYTDSGILSTSMAFLFLILNTVFWIVTSMVYKSRTILLFSFIFAYINPFLTGGSSDNPYTLVWYSMIISLGALFIGNKQNDNILKYSAFILGNILLLVAPFSTEIWWITKLIASAILGFLTIINFSQTGKENIPKIFIMNYIFIIGLLLAGADNGILEIGTSFISYMISILFFFAIGIWLFLKKSLKSIWVLFIFPIFIVLWLIFSGSVGFITPALAIIVLAYLIWFNFLESILAPTMKYIFFWILGIFIFIVNSFLSFHFVSLDFTSFITVIIISFIFLFTSYYFSRKDTLEFLYSIWTLWGILTLAPILVVNRYIQNDTIENTGDTLMRISQDSMFNISVIAVIFFALLNWILPFINRNLTKKWANIKNLLVWSIFWILFIGFQLFDYWNTYFPGITLGLSFWGLAIIYFILSYLMMNKIWVENIKSEVSSKNTILSYLFISISLFSLSIALVFANSPEVISTVWLFEATILFYFYNQTRETKVFWLWLMLFIIWILQLFDLNVAKKDFLFLIPFSIIFASLVYNLKFLDHLKNGARRVFHDIFHIIWIWILANLLIDIIPSAGHGWSIIWVSLFILVLWVIYSQLHSKILKIFYIIVISLVMFGQYDDLSSILHKIDIDEVPYLRILQYATFGTLTTAIILWNKYNNDQYYNKFINSSYVIYTLFIISSFVLDIFNTTFAVTIFWAIVSSMLLFYGISSDKIKLRTIWLYLLSLVLAKIFIYDIWYGLDDAVTRVVALIAIWVLLIIISTRYTRKYGNNLKWEFNFSNLVDKSSKNDSKDNISKNWNTQKIPKYNIINSQIQDIDISNIDSIKFYPNWEKVFSSKAKNVKKIVKLILKNNNTATFEPGELLEKYNYIIENYESELTKRDFNILKGVIKNFIDTWGKVEIK